MRFVDPPSLDSPARGRSSDDLDGLLSAFFHTELPAFWPGAPVGEEAPAILTRPARSLFRSRLALAASVAFLLGIPWVISDSFNSLTSDVSPAVSLGTGSADRSIKLQTSLQQQPNGEVILRIDAREVIENQVKDMLP